MAPYRTLDPESLMPTGRIEQKPVAESKKRLICPPASIELPMAEQQPLCDRPIPFATARANETVEKDNMMKELVLTWGRRAAWVLSARNPCPNVPKKLVSTDIVDDIAKRSMKWRELCQRTDCAVYGTRFAPPAGRALIWLSLWRIVLTKNRSRNCLGPNFVGSLPTVWKAATQHGFATVPCICSPSTPWAAQEIRFIGIDAPTPDTFCLPKCLAKNLGVDVFGDKTRARARGALAYPQLRTGPTTRALGLGCPYDDLIQLVHPCRLYAVGSA